MAGLTPLVIANLRFFLPGGLEEIIDSRLTYFYCETSGFNPHFEAENLASY